MATPDTDRIKRLVFGKTTNLPSDSTEAISEAVVQAELQAKNLQRWYVDATGIAGDSSVDSDWVEIAELDAVARLLTRYRAPLTVPSSAESSSSLSRNRSATPTPRHGARRSARRRTPRWVLSADRSSCP